MIELLYRGFDGLDVSFQGQITRSFADALERAKAQSQKFRSQTGLEWNGIYLSVFETGARGGYAYMATTGEFGATWFFKKPNIFDPWGVRVSCSSFLLATKGLGGARSAIYAVMEALEIALQPDAESIGRVDYALDFIAPGFSLVPDHFVMHSQTGRSDHHEICDLGVNGRSGRITSVTIGKMPGRQVIVYDKRAEIIAKRKPAWWEIWDACRVKNGLPTLVRDVAVDSQVWRVEIRAGKDYLKQRWTITSWRDLDARFGDMVAASLDAVRYTTPREDSNRSRWPDSLLWLAVRRHANEDIFEMRNYAAPELIKTVQRDEHDRLLTQLMTGILTSRAGLHNISIDRLAEFARFAGDQMAETVTMDPERFTRKLVESAARYYVHN